jgi:hypothetical protein
MIGAPIARVTMRKQIASLALLASFTACGGGTSAAAAGAEAPAPAQQTRNRAVITRAEIEKNETATNVFHLIERLRPNFLRVRGPSNWGGVVQTPMVRLNDQELGDAGTLRQIAVSSVLEIRYYSISEATAKFGGIRGRPVIAVTTK